MNTHIDVCIVTAKPRLRVTLLGTVLAIAASTAMSADQIDDQLAGLKQSISHLDKQIIDYE